MVFTGKITNVGKLEKGTSKLGESWASIDLVVTEVEGNYPNSAVFRLFKKGDNVKYAESFANDYPIGTMVKIEFNLKAKEYNSKFYQELSIWNISKPEKLSF